jgi:hypothetical protein
VFTALPVDYTVWLPAGYFIFCAFFHVEKPPEKEFFIVRAKGSEKNVEKKRLSTFSSNKLARAAKCRPDFTLRKQMG